MRNRLNFYAHEKTALIERNKQYSYSHIEAQTKQFATGLLDGSKDLNEERIAFLIPASLDYVVVLHGIWRAGGIAIPLNVSATESETEHCLSSSGTTRLIVARQEVQRMAPLCNRLSISLKTVGDCLSDASSILPDISAARRAMIIFTSGTTSKPKGVVTTHLTIDTQISTLIDAWEWTKNDVIPLFLPLHHVHGLINVLSCALCIGATVYVMPKLELDNLCRLVAANRFNLFMAVPTIYVKLIDHLESIDSVDAQAVRDGFRKMRLNVSGSAACPVTVFETWHRLTRQVLLERYGMTEIGMALSNPYHGDRRAGYVGQPLPGVNVNLFDESDRVIDEEGVAGEIRVKSDTVFLEYWGNPGATKSSFINGWFCTGDIGVLERGYYRIMGRSSVDIIKSGGYKLSALEIEGKLLDHPDISEVAVLGIEDSTWGEAVAAVVVPRNVENFRADRLKQWCEGKISSYKIPKKLVLVDSLPRNAMGKVVKPELRKLFGE